MGHPVGPCKLVQRCTLSPTLTSLQVCNHKFHSECLQQWGESCPVCRYCINSSHSSSCDVCGTSADLWICLICGHVGCGRYKEAHACAHFEQTNHCYSLELETGRVLPAHTAALYSSSCARSCQRFVRATTHSSTRPWPRQAVHNMRDIVPLLSNDAVAVARLPVQNQLW